MTTLLRRRTLWLTFNVLGVAIYLKLSSALWVHPGQQGMPGGPGDAFYWLFFVAPALAVPMVVNSAALVVIVRRLKATGNRTGLAIWCAIAILWFGSLVMNHQCAITHIDAQYS